MGMLGSERKGGLQQAVCYRAGGETRRLDLEEQEDRCGLAVSLFAALGEVALGLVGCACCSWGLGQSNKWR